MASQQCPKCDQINAVAKVTAIVLGGTRYRESSSTKADPSIDGDDIDWSFSFESVTEVNQTALARQLSFPDKAGGTMVGGWILTVFLGLLAVMFNAIKKDEIRATATERTASDLELLTNLYGICVFGAIVAFWVAVCATTVHVEGRSQALQTWNELYYCFRDDLLYTPRDKTQSGPASQLRALLRY